MVQNDLYLLAEERNNAKVDFCPGHLLPCDHDTPTSSKCHIIYSSAVKRPPSKNKFRAASLEPRPFAILTADSEGRGTVSLMEFQDDWPREPLALEVIFWRHPENPGCQLLPSHSVLIPGSVMDVTGVVPHILSPSGLSLVRHEERRKAIYAITASCMGLLARNYLRHRI